MASWLVHSSLNQAALVQALAGDIVLCSGHENDCWRLAHSKYAI